MAAIYKGSPVVLMFLSAFICIYLTAITEAARLNVPKVLLPYHSTTITNFSLEVTEPFALDTCFSWKSSRPEVVAVQLVNSTNGECSQHALVSAVSKSPHRMTAIITAENTVTSETLRCYVIVDTIALIQIETTTRELFLEDTPEDFFVLGFDDKGNLFDSLDGVIFEWTLISDTENSWGSAVDAHNVLRIKTFTESMYEMSVHICSLEERGLQGDRILVDGIRTGTAHVRVSLRDPAYKHVKYCTVRLIVRANLFISPPDVYVLRHATVKYKVEMIKKNTIITITMPSEQYYLDVETQKVCKLDTDTSTTTALEFGSTEIILRDRNIQIPEAFSPPSALLHVVSPSYLAFVVLPTKKWVLQTEREYDILIEVYDKDSHKIHPSDNVRIEAVFNTDFFNVMFSSKNGSFHHVSTLKRGYTQIDGSLKAIIMEDGNEFALTPELRHAQDVEIYDAIFLNPPLLYFPWDTDQHSYSYQLTATGGSGEYVWTSSDVVTTTVNLKGEITTHQIGSASITAADVKNQAHSDVMQVIILSPTAMEFLPSVVEAEIGTKLKLPLALYAQYNGVRVSFRYCHKMKLNITVLDTTTFSSRVIVRRSDESGCAMLELEALQPGSTAVTASYVAGNVQLQAKVTIAAYKPLKPIDPEDVAVVTIASSKEVVFDGGPLPWLQSTYFRELSPEKDSLVRFNHVTTFGIQRSFHVFNVLCRDFGEQVLTLRVGNKKSPNNQFPATSEAAIRFACTPPVSLQLLPKMREPSAQLPPCPIWQDHNQPLPVLCNVNTDIQVIILDNLGRTFDNFSSLAVEWSISDPSLATIDTPPDVMTETTMSEIGKKLVRAYQTLNVAGRVGKMVVTATISHYDQNYFRTYGIIISPSVGKIISKSVELVLVEEAVIDPSSISIFNHPSNKISLSIQKGSGYFHVDDNAAQILEVKYEHRQRRIQLSPLFDGSLTLTAYDLCLDGSDNPHSFVSVSGVGKIELSVVDKIEVTKEVRCRVRVLDVSGEPLAAAFFRLMNLHPQPDSDIITIRPLNEVSGDEFSAFYMVHGTTIGHTGLSFQAHLQTGQVVSSNIRNVEVFPPLHLNPSNITLIIGAHFQILAQGGPNPSSSITFTVASSEIAAVSSSGLLDALKLGLTRVVGQAVGYDPHTGGPFVYSEDVVSIHVIQLTGIKIHSPLTQILAQNEMPLYAMGMTEHETPFTFGSVNPPLKFSWSLSSKDVVSLRSIYHESNVILPDDNNIATHLVAIAPGHVTVKLQVRDTSTAGRIMSRALLSDEVQIKVYERLKLVSPSIWDGQFLMTSNTEAPLKTNRDGAVKLRYTITRQDPESLGLIIKPTGQVISNSGTGEATVVITAQEETGISQSLAIFVKVKAVSYLMLTTDSVFRSSTGHMTSIPVGAVISFNVHFHDDLGNRFQATNKGISYRLNRYDRLQLSAGSSNTSLVARATEVGQTILKVWNKDDSQLVDYIAVPVNYAISPAKVTLGLADIVCFSSTLISTRGFSGRWSSVGKSVSIEADSGIAMATQISDSLVQLDLSDGVVTYTEVSVLPVMKLMVSTSHTFLTNVRGRASSYVVSVGVGKESNLVGDNCSAVISESQYTVPAYPFRCQLEMASHHTEITITDLFQAKPYFDHQTGKYQCIIDHIPSDYLSQQVSSVNTEIHLKVLILSQEHQAQIEAPLVKFTFYPAFYVHSSEIHLSNLSPLSSIRLSISERLMDQIQVSSNEPEMVEVMAGEKDAHVSTLLLFPIRLMETTELWDSGQLDVTLTLICQATGQQEVIPVVIKLVGQRPEYIMPRPSLSKLHPQLVSVGIDRSLNSLPINAFNGGMPPGNYTVRSKDGGWTSTFRNIATFYQSWLLIFFTFIIAAALIVIVYNTIIWPRYGIVNVQPGAYGSPGSPMVQGIPYGYAQSPATPFTPAVGMTATPTQSNQFSPGIGPQHHRLWSIGYRPQETSPTRHRPQRSPQSLASSSF